MIGHHARWVKVGAVVASFIAIVVVLSMVRCPARAKVRVSSFSGPTISGGATVGVADGVTITGAGTIASPYVAVSAAQTAIYFNVKAYGATGNGTTDDTAAIRSAATAASAIGGGVVYFPDGTYLISENGTSFVCLNMYSGVSWVGQSRDGVILLLSAVRASDSTPTRASVRPFSTDGTGIQDFSIENLTVDGNSANQTVVDLNHRDDIFLWAATRVTVRNVELRNATGSGIVVFGAIANGGSDVAVDHVYVHDNQWMGISWGDSGTTYRTRVTDSYFTRNQNGLHIEVSQPNGQIVFDHDYLDGNGGLALEIAGSVAPNQTSNVWVQHCTTNGGVVVTNAAQVVLDSNNIVCADSTANDTVPVLVDGDSQDVFVTHNTITLGVGGTAIAAVQVTGNASTTTAVDNVVVSDNTIYVQTTQAAGVRVQPTGTIRVERNKVIAFGATAWQANTPYGAAIHTSSAMRVSNGGNVYQAIAGTSASSGGPAGTGAAIVDGTVVWNYASVGSGQPQWTATTQYRPGTKVRNGGNIYTCIAGTSASSGGPAGTGSSIADGTIMWEYVGALSTTQYGVDVNMSIARSGDAVYVRGNYVADFNTGAVTEAVASTVKLNYVDISDNTFEAVTPGVMTNGIQWEVDTRASVNAARSIGNKVIGNAVTLIGSYPHASLLIGGNDGGVSIWSSPSAPAMAANPGSLAMSRAGGAGVTFYVKESGTGTSGWVAALTQTQGAYAVVGQAPAQAAMVSGRFYALPNFGSLSTNNTFGVGTVRALPFWVPNTITVSQLGVEVTAGGDATSVCRIGIYADDGTGRPGALVADAGTVAVNSGGAGVPGVLMITGLSIALAPGSYWAGAVLQGTLTTQPTFRTIDARGIMPNLDLGTATPGAAAVVSGVNMTGITGALPSPFVVASLASTTPRILMKVQ